MVYKIINAISSTKVPKWGNTGEYLAIHYLGVTGENHDLDSDGCGAHYYIYKDGTIYQRCSNNAIVYQVGTAGMYTQKHPTARNANTIGIELCCNCDGNPKSAEDPKWWFTQETQEAAVWLVRKLMEELNIPSKNVLRHYDIVNKTCPAPYVHNNGYRGTWTWYEFKRRVSGASNAATEGTQTSEFSALTETQAAARLLEICRPVAEKYYLFPSVATAQCILESGYCKTELAKSANNVCGMKCTLSGNTWPGSTWDGISKVTIQTAEQDKSGNTYYINADFRKYPCIEDSVADRCAYLIGAMNGSKLRYAGITDCQDYKTQIQLIKDGGYATDVSYVSKICNIIERFGLDEYDDNGKASKQSSDSVQYYVRKTWSDKSSQLGAYSVFQNAKNQADANWRYNVYDASGKEVYNGTKALIDRAVSFAVGIANDDSHGYNNSGNGWGPDEYNCIGLVMRAYKAAGNDPGVCNIDQMPEYLKSAGFEDVTSKVNLKTGNGAVKGDVFWMLDSTGKHGHTELYAGDGQLAGARGDFDGKTGDSSGNEITVSAYANMNWQKVFRIPGGYTLQDSSAQSNTDAAKDVAQSTSAAKTYKVQVGSYSVKTNAEKMMKKVKAAGFDALLKKEDSQWKVQCGSFSIKSNAQALVKKLKAAGFAAIVKTY